MRGLDRLLRLRRDGLRPQDPVKFDTDPTSREYAGWIVVDEGDKPAETDLRAMLGLDVIVSATAFATADKWAMAICKAGASSVAVYVVNDYEVTQGPAFLKFKGEMLA